MSEQYGGDGLGFNDGFLKSTGRKKPICWGLY